jgi:hypothetical protein
LLLLISENRTDLEFATQLAQALKTDLLHPKEIEEQTRLLCANPREEVIFDADMPEHYSRIEARLLKPELILPRFHFVTSEGLDRCRPVLQSPFFLSQIRRSDSMVQSSKLFASFCEAFVGDVVLGMDGAMSDQRDQRNFPIESNLEKTTVLEKLTDYLRDAQIGARNLATVVQAADELLMNAIFDAPVDEMGTRISIASTRTSPIRLQGKRRIELKAGFNSTHVAVQVRDFFGSLERGRLFEKLAEVYGLNDYKIDRRSAGAGLGLASVYRSGGSLLFHCSAGELTSVTALFSRAETAQKLRDCFRFIKCEFR